MLDLTDFSCLKGFRFARSVIGYAVGTYHRLALILRDVEDLFAERGITVSYETIRGSVGRSGPQIAAKVQCKRPAEADKWHLDEVVVPIEGRKYSLWRAVDAKGDVLDILVQSRREKVAAMRFFRKLYKIWGLPRVLVTDKLRSYRAAMSYLASSLGRSQHKGLNNRAESSHWHTRRRERVMGRFKSPTRHSGFSRFTIETQRCPGQSATACPRPPTTTPEPTLSIFGTDTPLKWAHEIVG